MTVKEIEEYFRKNGRSALVFEKIDSTNTYLKKNPKEFGTIALALSQSAGHGQYDRAFESPKSGLYMSVCVKFVADFPMTLAAANAVTDTLSWLFSLSCEVKWVNDIMSCGRKLCGILAESVFCGENSFTVIGFGMNLKKGGLSEEISKIAISLDELVDEKLPYDTLACLALKIAENLEKELSQSRESVIKKYRERCITEIPENAVFI